MVDTEGGKPLGRAESTIWLATCKLGPETVLNGQIFGSLRMQVHWQVVGKNESLL